MITYERGYDTDEETEAHQGVTELNVTQACLTPKTVHLIKTMPGLPDTPRSLHPAPHSAEGVALTLAPMGPGGPLSPFKPIGP